MVGAAGFEPTTTRTPSEYATGLRYAPTSSLYDSDLYCRLCNPGKAMGMLRKTYRECASMIFTMAWRSPRSFLANS